MSYTRTTGVAALCLGVLHPLSSAGGDLPSPPATARQEVREKLHGVELVDPFRWLEDQWSKDTRAWIEAQNGYTRSRLEALPQRRAVEATVAEVFALDTASVPRVRGDRYFYERRKADEELAVIAMREGAKGPERVLVDPHSWSADHTKSVNLEDVSEDGRWVLYSIQEGGEDEEVVRVFDVGAGKDTADALPKARYSGMALSPDGRRIYYSRHRRDSGPRVFVHEAGGDPAGDRLLFGDGYGPEKIIGLGASSDGRWIIMVVYYGSAADRTEVYLLDATVPPAEAKVVTVVNDLQARFMPEAAAGRVYLHTNWNAPRGRVVAVDLADPRREKWKEVVPQGKGSLEDVTLAGGRIFAQYLEDVRPVVKVYEPEGGYVRDIEFPAVGTAGALRGAWGRPEVFFEFESFHLPPTVYAYHVGTGERTVWHRPEVPLDSDAFEVRQEWYASKDGTRVPIFLAHRKGLARDGSHPALLTGYGGFIVNVTPTWSSRAAAWLRLGGVFALPALRGGGEFGEEWHRAGMLGKKQNVFDDFVGAAEWLVKNGYTRPERLGIFGRSNGGLLTGAALTQRPDLFGAVIIGYPLLDMIRYHNFLVARFWVPEYGSSEDPEQFRYLLDYSPYHNVEPGAKYPAVLLITGDSDTRVDPLHARKMTARLQAATGSGEPVLLRYDTKAGHSSGAPVSMQVEELTDELAFLAWQLGVKPVEAPAASSAAR